MSGRQLLEAKVNNGNEQNSIIRMAANGTILFFTPVSTDEK
jgi:hypothetical protein